MAIPDYQSLMLPLLKLASDGTEHRLQQAVEALADEFALSDAERAELLPSGASSVFTSRVGWANTYLKQAGVLAAPRRGVFRITPAGIALLATNPSRIDNRVLDRFESFRVFRTKTKAREEPAAQPALPAAVDQTPGGRNGACLPADSQATRDRIARTGQVRVAGVL